MKFPISPGEDDRMQQTPRHNIDLHAEHGQEFQAPEDFTITENLRRRKEWLCVDFPVVDYKEIRELQVGLVAARKSGLISKNILLLLEHTPVFTLGARGGLENLTTSEDVLQEAGISVVRVERGGNITYHGPGQLVGYPIINLHKANLSITGYVGLLEEVMIKTANHWGVNAVRNSLNRGVWVGNNKLGSIGVAVRHGISFHGFAFNVNLSLTPFNWINPCGLPGIKMTSLKQEISCELSMNEVREQIKLNIEEVFEVRLTPTDPTILQRLLHESEQ